MRGHAITDDTRFFIILALLSFLPDRYAREELLRRRLAFIEYPATFFYRGTHPRRSTENH